MRARKTVRVVEDGHRYSRSGAIVARALLGGRRGWRWDSRTGRSRTSSQSRREEVWEVVVVVVVVLMVWKRP